MLLGTIGVSLLGNTSARRVGEGRARTEEGTIRDGKDF